MLLAISFVYSALISIPNFVEVLSSLVTRSESSFSFPAINAVDVVGESEVCDVPSSNTNCAIVVFQNFTHYSFKEDVEEHGADKTSLANTIL